MVIFAGLDPAGTEKRPTGLAIIKNNIFIFIGKLYRDNEIIDKILFYKPVVLAIDSPLSYSKGYREVDLLMKKLGYKVLPPGWRSMQILIHRSLRIKSILEKRGVKVIETHPLSALKSSGCKTLDELLAKLNIKLETKNLSKDEKDAAIASLVAKFYYNNKSYMVKAKDGIIHLLPKICS